MREDQMLMLLASISAALAHNDCKRAMDMSNAGMTMLIGAEAEAEAAWHEIERLSRQDYEKAMGIKEPNYDPDDPHNPMLELLLPSILRNQAGP